MNYRDFNLVGICVFIGLMILSSSCSENKHKSSKAKNPNIEAWSCSYSQDILQSLLTTKYQEYVARGDEYKGFVFFDIRREIRDEPMEDKIMLPYWTEGSSVSSEKNENYSNQFRFYTVSYTYQNKYTNNDLEILKNLASKKIERSDLQEYSYTPIAYNFIDKGNGHCDVEVFSNGEIYTLSDQKENFTLRKLLPSDCENKLKFVEASNGDLRVESSDEKCLNLKTGFIRIVENRPSDFVKRYKSYLELNESYDNYYRSVKYNAKEGKDYYLDHVVNRIDKKFYWRALSSFISGECRTNIKNLYFDSEKKYTKIEFKTTQNIDKCFVEYKKLSIIKSPKNLQTTTCMLLNFDWDKELGDVSKISWDNINVNEGMELFMDYNLQMNIAEYHGVYVESCE